MSAERDASQDALRLPFPAVHSGGEGQDLGLPLLHVLGKKPGAEGLTSRSPIEAAACRERHQDDRENGFVSAHVSNRCCEGPGGGVLPSGR